MKDLVAADQAAEVAVLAAATPIVARIMAAEMVGMTTIPAVHLRLDRVRWVATSAASAAKRGTGRATAGPSRRRKRRIWLRRKSH
jgi:hypothetical protein